METRKNILMDVSPKPVAREPTPPPPEPKPTEQDIFKKRELESVEEELPQISEPVAPPKKQKRPCSDKMKAHLSKCREKALAKKKAVKESQRQPPPIPTAQAQEQRQEYKPIPQAQAQNYGSIDYDKIISGVSDRMYKKQEEDKYVADYEANIRKDEREKAKKEYTGYFVDAATKFKKNTYAGFGRQTIYGNAKQLNHPVFGKQAQYKKDSKNPFDACFQ